VITGMSQNRCGRKRGEAGGQSSKTCAVHLIPSDGATVAVSPNAVPKP
jgi:hypothetical protein